MVEGLPHVPKQNKEGTWFTHQVHSWKARHDKGLWPVTEGDTFVLTGYDACEKETVEVSTPMERCTESVQATSFPSLSRAYANPTKLHFGSTGLELRAGWNYRGTSPAPEHTCMYECVCAYTNLHICVCLYTCVCVCLCVCLLSGCVCVCCVHVCVCAGLC